MTNKNITPGLLNLLLATTVPAAEVVAQYFSDDSRILSELNIISQGKTSKYFDVGELVGHLYENYLSSGSINHQDFHRTMSRPLEASLTLLAYDGLVEREVHLSDNVGSNPHLYKYRINPQRRKEIETKINSGMP